MDKMIVNRYNYQDYFLLYTDNELEQAERIAVEDFVQQNPDLAGELTMLLQLTLIPDESIIFENKELLLQFNNEEELITADNFTTFAISYADNELDEAEKSRFENFIRKHAHYQQEAELINKLKLSVDESIVFPEKHLLYRHEQTGRHFIFPWVRIAAAAIILLFAGILWMNRNPSVLPSKNIAQISKAVPFKEPIGKRSEIKENKKSAISSNNITDATTQSANTALSQVVKNDNYKKGILKNKSYDKTTTSVKDHIAVVKRSSTENDIAGSDKDDEFPRAVRVDRNSRENPEIKAEGIAAIDASIDKRIKGIREQPIINVNKSNDDSYTLVKTVADTETEENGLLTNTLADKKNPLRGILRKASRFLDKNTSFKIPKKSGLLIGNVEIAFQ